MLRRLVFLVVVGALVASASATAAGTGNKVKLKFPKACTGVVYRVDVTPTGPVSAISVRNTAPGNALPASIRAVAAVATAGKTVVILVFMNNLAPRQLSAAQDNKFEIEMSINGAVFKSFIVIPTLQLSEY